MVDNLNSLNKSQVDIKLRYWQDVTGFEKRTNALILLPYRKYMLPFYWHLY